MSRLLPSLSESAWRWTGGFRPATACRVLVLAPLLDPSARRDALLMRRPPNGHPRCVSAHHSMITHVHHLLVRLRAPTRDFAAQNDLVPRAFNVGSPGVRLPGAFFSTTSSGINRQAARPSERARRRRLDHASRLLRTVPSRPLYDYRSRNYAKHAGFLLESKWLI